MTYHSKAERPILLCGEIFLPLLRPLRGRSLAAASIYINIRQRSGVMYWQNNTVAMQKKIMQNLDFFKKDEKIASTQKMRAIFGGFQNLVALQSL